MENNIYAGQRILYKHNNQWHVGELAYSTHAVVNNKGLYLEVVPREYIGQPNCPMLQDAEIHDIFFDAQPVEESWKEYSDIFISKQDYITMIEEDEEFEKNAEQAFVSDGEYYYYRVNKFNRTWLEKQPFDYIVRLN